MERRREVRERRGGEMERGREGEEGERVIEGSAL